MQAAGLGGTEGWRLLPARTVQGARFFCAPAPNQGGEESGGPSSGSHSGEDAPGAMGCQACHHDNSCSWKPEVGGVEQPLPHADAAWERRGLLGCLPTHPALSLDLPLYKGGTIRQALTEKETRRRTGGDREEGDYHQCPPPLLLTGQKGQSWVRWEWNPSQLLLPGRGVGEDSLPGGPWLWANELPYTSGKEHPPDPCPPTPALRSSLLTTS